jgi:MFS family permease
MVLLGRTYLPEAPAVSTTAKAGRRLPPIVYLLGALMFFAFMVEGTVADWNGLFMRDTLGAPEALAALGYPVFEVGMLVARLTGDRLRTRFGVRGIMTASGVATAGFFAVVLAAPAPLVAVLAMFFVGLGVATISPMTLSLAGTATDTPGPAIAQAGAMGYAGLLLGPVAIGFLTDATSLRVALGIAVVLGVAIAVAARFLPREEPAAVTAGPAVREPELATA